MLRYLIPARARRYAAVVAIILGVYFLLRNFNILPDSWDIGILWPLLLIVPGVLFLFEKDAKDNADASKR